VRAPGGSGRRDVSRGPLLPQRFSPNPPLRLAENTRVVRRRLCCYGNRFKLFASFARMLELSRGYHMAHLRGQAVKKSLVLKRSIVIAGHKTSVSLEGKFLDSLKEIAVERGITIKELVAAIDADREHGERAGPGSHVGQPLNHQHEMSNMPAEAQATFCRRRHQPRRPPLAKIRPGRPAPTMGPGTLGAGLMVRVMSACEVRKRLPDAGS
jgi:hypothetical protein